MLDSGTLGGKSQGITKSLFFLLHSLGLGKSWSKVFLLLLYVFSSGDLDKGQRTREDKGKGATSDLGMHKALRERGKILGFLYCPTEFSRAEGKESLKAKAPGRKKSEFTDIST